MPIEAPSPDTAETASYPSPSPLAHQNSLWLHGAGLSGDTWHTITADLPGARTPDLPGHGAADRIHPPTVEGYADTLTGMVPRDAILIGHSLGGMVALELAVRAADRVSALILIEAVPTVRDRLSGQISANLAAWLFGRIPPLWLAGLAGLGQPPTTKAELRRQLSRLDRARVGAALSAASQYDGRSRLPLVKVPTLVIAGEGSGATLHGARLMANTIPDAEFLRLPGGHMLHTDNPSQIRRAIDDFLRSRAATTEMAATNEKQPTSGSSSTPQ